MDTPYDIIKALEGIILISGIFGFLISLPDKVALRQIVTTYQFTYNIALF